MIDSMYTVLNRINEITERFALKRHNPESGIHSSSEKLRDSEDFQNTLKGEIAGREGSIASDAVPLDLGRMSGIGILSSIIRGADTDNSYNPFYNNNHGTGQLRDILKQYENHSAEKLPLSVTESGNSGIRSYVETIIEKAGAGNK